MDVADITAENVAKAVGGTVERDGSILCCCPIHEASGTHNPSLLLSITDDAPHPVSLPVAELRRQAFPGHPRPSGQKWACRDRMSAATARTKRSATTTNISTGAMPGRKPGTSRSRGRSASAARCWTRATRQWSTGRPDGMPLLFNLATVASVLAAYPATPLLIVEGEKDVHHGGRIRPARHHQRRRRRQVARRRHPNANQTGSSKGCCLPRQ